MGREKRRCNLEIEKKGGKITKSGLKTLGNTLNVGKSHPQERSGGEKSGEEKTAFYHRKKKKIRVCVRGERSELLCILRRARLGRKSSGWTAKVLGVCGGGGGRREKKTVIMSIGGRRNGSCF